MILLALGLILQHDEPEDAAARFQTAPGTRVSVFAAEPDVVNPVGLHVDDRGRVFVAETRRYNTSALYVKQHPTWYFDDLACRSVDDRLRLAEKFLGAGAAKLEVDSEIVKLLVDVDGDGRSDRATVYADGFRSRLDGVASGVITRGDSVWLTNVPDLWRLRGAEKAESRERLAHGFGVRFGNSGHDLHGLCWGPDGKLYFTMGDRGLNVGGIALPDEGAVLRCDPDGKNLELVARGLRNPQGLTFDVLGNLWTVDNNADMGDPARALHIVEGGDYGWRVSYQYATEPWEDEELKPGVFWLRISKDTPWMNEEIWSGKAPYALPTAGAVSRGPCGLTAYPGTGLSSAYDGRFFLCDFPGGVHSFAAKPAGASYVIDDIRPFLWGGWPTDAKFGPDGALYVADWVYGFPMTGKGRIFKVEAVEKDPRAAETRRLLAEGMEGRDVPSLIELLGHADHRVRQNAQFELVARGASKNLAAAALQGPLVRRLHAIWGLGQLGAPPRLVEDPEPEIRVQVAKLTGDPRLFKDPSPRVRFHAILKGGDRAAAFDALRENDPWLRHAAVMALLREPEGLIEAAEKEPASVRLGALLALRRLASPKIARYLKDPELAFEAARAINDVPIPEAMGALADRLPDAAPSWRLRALSAAFRRGDAKAIAALGDAEALAALAAWGRPARRERVSGAWRPIPPRDPAPAREALDAVLDAIDPSPALCKAVAALGLKRYAPRLEELARSGPAAVRIEAWRALLTLDVARGEALLAPLMEDVDHAVRAEAIQQAPRLGARAVEPLRGAAEGGPVPLRQAAVGALGRVPGPAAEKALEELLAGLDVLPAALRLDLREAVERRPSLRDKLPKPDPADPLGPWRESLEGGDAQLGRKIFNERSTVACLRCHKGPTGGGEVGPPLGKIGGERTAEQLLESIVFPNKLIAPGYGQEIVRTSDGTVETGRVKAETASELVLIRADGREKRLPKSEIGGRKAGLSAMPDDLIKSLTPRDLRDLVAYLRSLR